MLKGQEISFIPGDRKTPVLNGPGCNSFEPLTEKIDNDRFVEKVNQDAYEIEKLGSMSDSNIAT